MAASDPVPCQHGTIPGSVCLYCATPGMWSANTFWPAVPQGWQCPVCRHVYAPSVATCMRCPAETVVVTNGSGSASGCTCGTTIPCPQHNATDLTHASRTGG